MPFNNPYWNLNETKAWINFRNPEIVDKVGGNPLELWAANIYALRPGENEETHKNLLSDQQVIVFNGEEYTLDEALQTGKLSAEGRFKGEGESKAIPQSILSQYTIDKIMVLKGGYYTDIQFPQSQILKLWRGQHGQFVKVGRKPGNAEKIADANIRHRISNAAKLAIEKNLERYDRWGGKKQVAEDIVHEFPGYQVETIARYLNEDKKVFASLTYYNKKIKSMG